MKRDFLITDVNKKGIATISTNDSTLRVDIPKDQIINISSFLDDDLQKVREKPYYYTVTDGKASEINNEEKLIKDKEVESFLFQTKKEQPEEKNNLSSGKSIP